MLSRATLAFIVLAPIALSNAAQAAPATARKTSAQDLAFDVQRSTTKAGMVVLLSPDPRVSSVVVDISFRAGTLFEPADRSGLAHLVEHLMFRGSTPDTDYMAILERRSARLVNAYTTAVSMSFRSVVPREELPLALWVAADRLISVLDTLTEADLEREKNVVQAERAQVFLDLPYAPAETTIGARLYPEHHPMRGDVLGVPDELRQVTLADVRAYAERYLVPANATLAITGAFDPAVAHQHIEENFGQIPAGTRATAPKFIAHPSTGAILKIGENMSRHPRVTYSWRFPSDVAEHILEALDFGALLLSIYTSGSFGTAVAAEFVRHEGEAIFRLDVMLPYEKSISAAQDEAESYLRYLTRVPFPEALVEAVLLARDRSLLFALDSPSTRATLMSYLELSGKDPTRLGKYFSRLWTADLGEVQRIARSTLGAPSLIVHAVPANPRKPKVERVRVQEDADRREEDAYEE